MAYVYKKVKKSILFGKNPGEKFLLAMATEGKVDTEMLCEFIMRNSTISEQDVKILMRSLTEVISENIEMGRGVNLEELGVFSPNFMKKSFCFHNRYQVSPEWRTFGRYTAIYRYRHPSFGSAETCRCCRIRC